MTDTVVVFEVEQIDEIAERGGLLVTGRIPGNGVVSVGDVATMEVDDTWFSEVIGVEFATFSDPRRFTLVMSTAGTEHLTPGRALLITRKRPTDSDSSKGNDSVTR